MMKRVHECRRTGAAVWRCVSVFLAASLAATSAAGTPADQQAIRDPIARLQQRIDSGQTSLSFDSQHGYLESLLGTLNVPSASQALVFSKTSFQASRISPRSPRAIYFNDDLYIGWIQDGQVLEIAAVDPKQGPVFYLLRQRQTERPRFVRETARVCNATNRKPPAICRGCSCDRSTRI